MRKEKDEFRMKSAVRQHTQKEEMARNGKKGKDRE